MCIDHVTDTPVYVREVERQHIIPGDDVRIEGIYVLEECDDECELGIEFPVLHIVGNCREAVTHLADDVSAPIYRADHVDLRRCVVWIGERFLVMGLAFNIETQHGRIRYVVPFQSRVVVHDEFAIDLADVSDGRSAVHSHPRAQANVRPREILVVVPDAIVVHSAPDGSQVAGDAVQHADEGRTDPHDFLGQKASHGSFRRCPIVDDHLGFELALQHTGDVLWTLHRRLEV